MTTLFRYGDLYFTSRSDTAEKMKSQGLAPRTVAPLSHIFTLRELISIQDVLYRYVMASVSGQQTDRYTLSTVADGMTTLAAIDTALNSINPERNAFAYAASASVFDYITQHENDIFTLDLSTAKDTDNEHQ